MDLAINNYLFNYSHNLSIGLLLKPAASSILQVASRNWIFQIYKLAKEFRAQAKDGNVNNLNVRASSQWAWSFAWSTLSSPPPRCASCRGPSCSSPGTSTSRLSGPPGELSGFLNMSRISSERFELKVSSFFLSPWSPIYLCVAGGAHSESHSGLRSGFNEVSWRQSSPLTTTQLAGVKSATSANCRRLRRGFRSRRGW